MHARVNFTEKKQTIFTHDYVLGFREKTLLNFVVQ